MKKFSVISFLSILLSLCSLGAETEIQIPGLFINPEGYIATPYQKIADSTEIKLVLKNSEIIYTIAASDVLNNLSILKPATPLTVHPAPLLMDTLKENEKVTCRQFVCYPSIAPVYKPIEGKIKSLTGVKGDIHHFQVEFPKDSILKEGFVFNNNGICLGFISNQQTDIYSLIQNPVGTSQVTLVKKMEFLFPLVKNLNNVTWSKADLASSAEETKKILKESLVTLKVKINPPAVEKAIDFNSIRAKIPANALFIYISISSGYEQGGFATLLMEALQEKKIGKSVDPSLKQNYYASIFEKFGQTNLAPEELVKMAADLADGYFLEASCSIASGTAEDSVILKVYKPRSSEILAEVKTAEVLSLDSSETLKQLTQNAVKNLSKELKSKKVKNLFMK